MVEGLSRLLDDDECEVVRGDLAECGTSAAHALREMLGLVIRHQAVLWCDWRPWFVLASVVIPIGLLLSYATRSWGVTSGTDISIYWRFWDFCTSRSRVGGVMSLMLPCGSGAGA